MSDCQGLNLEHPVGKIVADLSAIFVLGIEPAEFGVSR